MRAPNKTDWWYAVIKSRCDVVFIHPGTVLQNVLADGRLSVGYEMVLEKDRADYCRGNGRFSVATSMLANYAGPDYPIGGQVDPLSRIVKMAYYGRVSTRCRRARRSRWTRSCRRPSLGWRSACGTTSPCTGRPSARTAWPPASGTNGTPRSRGPRSFS